MNGDGYTDVIVGAEGFDNPELDEGRAFVYYGSSSGLTAANWADDIDLPDAGFGASVATAGDVNGDGYADIIVGAPGYQNVEVNEGAAFVYFGSASGPSATANWNFEINLSNAEFGFSVATAGDVNSDGYSDIIVGAPGYSNPDSSEGGVFVFHGSGTGPSVTANWSAEGDQAGAKFGSSVATAGDVNGDGYGDVIIGADNYDGGQADEGKAYVYHGSLSGLKAKPDWSVESGQASAGYGVSVATAGDVNGDGYSDIIVGAGLYDNGETDEGRAFVYYGSASDLKPINLSSPPPFTADWSAQSNQKQALFGYVNTAGDVNGDGYSDIIIGARMYDNGELNEGMVFVYHGSATGPGSTPDWSYESNQAGAELGISVSTAGDVNGDGYSDIIVGALRYDNPEIDEGMVFVFHGGPTGLSSTPDWTAEGNQAGAILCAVATAGDVNGDGYSDVIIAASSYDNPETDEGKAFVYYGSGTGLGAFPAWTAEGDQAGATFGMLVNTAGDVNGDGYSDIIIGAPYHDVPPFLVDAGRVYVYYGSPTGPNITADRIYDGDQAGAILGISVSTAGDVNGDGYSDAIAGACWYETIAPFDVLPEKDGEGRVYVYYGSSTGLGLSANWTANGDVNNAQLGNCVSTAGDVNGDGYSDIIVGAHKYDNGQFQEGRGYIWLGSASGLNATPDWFIESNQPWEGSATG